MLAQGWRSLPCTKAVLDISLVLCSGQSFRWKETDGIWTGVHDRKVWQLKQDGEQIWYKILNDDGNQIGDIAAVLKLGRKRKKKETRSGKGTKVLKLEKDIDENNNYYYTDDITQVQTLTDYFQLAIDLDDLCNHWIISDSHFAAIWKVFPGVRMLRQDPVENLFSFICSSNNNITRISSMVEKMCAAFGEKIHCADGVVHFSFPEIAALAKPKTEETLRKLGFGYRAKYIHQSAIQIEKNGGRKWLYHLRDLPYEEAHAELVKLPGIGAKVADCICMMSLDKAQAIPVDTHVWQIATRDYNISKLKGTKTLTAKTYKAIGDFFRNLWGSHAAWAMNFLFVADLKQFQNYRKENTSEVKSDKITSPKKVKSERKPRFHE